MIHQTPSRGFSLSVVIPTLNEAANIVSSINSVQKGDCVEVIVADGGSTDDTATLARSRGAKVISSKRGRGCQLNAGWKETAGQWCIFLHGDSWLPDEYASLIREAVKRSTGSKAGANAPVWGCFSTIQTEFHDSLHGKLLSLGVRLRTQLLQKPYGDQALFVERKTLQSLGGFRDWPFMEDVELVDRLKRLSPPAIVDRPIQTSGRRWQKLGFWKTMALNNMIVLSYYCGLDVNTLADWYVNAK